MIGEKLTAIVLSIAVVLMVIYGEDLIEEQIAKEVSMHQIREQKQLIETKVNKVDPSVLANTIEDGEPLSLYASELALMFQNNKRIMFVDCKNEWNPICVKFDFGKNN